MLPRRALGLAFVTLAACGSSTPPDPFAAGRTDAGFTDAPSFDVNRPETFIADRGPTPEVVDLTDVSLNRDVPSDVACASSLDGMVVLTTDGGLVASRDTVTLGAPRRFLFERTVAGGAALRCETTIPACGGGGVDVGVVAAALADPEVQAAFAMGNVFYGVDSRPVDGEVLLLRRGAAQVYVGEPCRVGGGPECVGAPPGVQRLVDALNALKEQETLREPCRSTLGLDGGA
ncbi:MAG: hypothetical protein R3A52_24840 [Polyangiales bacterium]